MDDEPARPADRPLRSRSAALGKVRAMRSESTKVMGLLRCWWATAVLVIPCAAIAQSIPLNPAPPAIRVCPGAFPTDLTSNDCRYKVKDRALDYVSGSITDQAVLGAVVFGLGAQIIQSPADWKRTWDGYGHRVGSRYTQAVGKGTAQFLVGWALRDDPRFLAYRDDPGVIKRRRQAVEDSQSAAAASQPLTRDGWQRFGHAWWDVVTVRRSSQNGDGRRIPALSRFAGEFGGAYAGYPWYHAPENSFSQVGQRAAGAFGTAVLSSFYTEYKPEIAMLLGSILRRGGQPKKNPGGHP